MNVIHLSPHFPENYYHFSVALRRLGVNVLGIADAPYEALRPELREALTEYYRVESMEDYGQLYRAVAHLCSRHGKMDALDSFSEYWLETEARLRTDFNIPGIKDDGIELIKRKSRMKERFVAAGLAVARGRVVRTLAEALGFFREVGGVPVVAKPDIGVGALHTYKICTEAEVREFIAGKPPVDYIMEEFIDGEMLTFDGLVDHDGEPVFISSLVYKTGIMETVNGDDDVYYYTLREIPADLEDAGRRTLQAFGLRARFFHLEYFRRRSDGKIVALEVNMRPPGGLTTDMFNYANDFDIYQEWANVLVHNRFTARYARPYHCAYVGRKFRLDYAHAHEEVLARLGPAVVHHTPISGIFSSALGNYGYLVRARTLPELQAAIRYIQE